MKEKLEKQILEWQQELSKQKQTKEQANQVLVESSKNIERLEGGILFGQSQIKLLEQEEEKSVEADLKIPEPEKK
jgi:predicted  nucleic acid-binding Zn-ribbon protein